jgi:hypothetical protein
LEAISMISIGNEQEHNQSPIIEKIGGDGHFIG